MELRQKILMGVFGKTTVSHKPPKKIYFKDAIPNTSVREQTSPSMAKLKQGNVWSLFHESCSSVPMIHSNIQDLVSPELYSSILESVVHKTFQTKWQVTVGVGVRWGEGVDHIWWYSG